MTDSPFLADRKGNTSQPEPNWQIASPGFELTTTDVAVSAAYQAEKLNACGIDPEIFGTQVDPSFFIGIGIHAGIRSGISAEGNVNMLQRLIQYRPVKLDEVLQVAGRIESVKPVPRGHTVQTQVSFKDASGAVVIDASRTSLRPDPSKDDARGAGARPGPVVAEPEAALQINSHELTPQQVKDYSTEGNSIHYEEAAAKAAGFRAPMIGGGMGVHYLAAAIWKQGAPAHLNLDIYFRRPIFWDEVFTTAILGVPEQCKTWQALCLLRDEKERGLKVLTEARINKLQHFS